MIASMLSRFGKNIIVQRATTTTGGYTGDTVVWNTHLTTTAVIRPTNGNDIITLQKIGLEADYKIYIECADIQEKDRILYDNKYYLISWIQEPMTAGEFLQVYIKGSDNIGANSI
jgi:SPP1 family predicted phage head-tail adaptor